MRNLFEVCHLMKSTLSVVRERRGMRQSLMWLPLTVWAWVVAFAAVAALGACSRSHAGSEGDRRRLAAIDDSVMHHAPSARRLLAEGMSAAGDSITFYEYYMRMGKYFMLSDTPDSMQPYINRTIAFAMRQKPSPRVNALMAAAYSCAAIRLHNFHQHPDSVISL